MAEKKKAPAPQKGGAKKTKKKKSILKRWWFWVLIFFFILLIVPKDQEKPETGGNGQPTEPNVTDHDQPSDSQSSADEPTGTPDQRTPEQAMDTVLWLLEAGVSQKYDGYSIDHDETSFTIKVWKESLTKSMEISSGAADQTWVMVKNNTQNTVDYLYDCIQTSELSEMSLNLHLVNHEDQTKTLLSFQNTQLIYDALAQ